jgi:hypothetical protein
MSGGTSLEQRIRRELDLMRNEIGAQHPAPVRVLSRSRRAMATTVAAVVLVAAVAVTGSVAAWHAVGPGGSSRPVVPATEGAASPTGTLGTGPVAADPAVTQGLMARPLALPTLPPGGSCPTTPMTTVTPGRGTGFSGSAPAQRAGHVYLAYTGRDMKLRAVDRPKNGWYAIKDIWVVDGSYGGPVLIRGGRIDRPGRLELNFSSALSRRDALLLDGGAPSLQWDPSTRWWSVPTVAYVRTPGCYAYRIDGTDFTTFIVFSAHA